MKDKKKLTLTIVAVVAFIAVVVGATYAYFVANVGSGSGANINATTGTTDSLSFNTGSRINIYATTENFGQGLGNQADSTTASATLVANNGSNHALYNYYMYLDISKNELKYTTLDKRAELILTVTDKEGMPITSIEGLDYVTVGDVSGFDITESQGLITILNNHEIETTGTEVHEWNITVTLINLGSNQSENLNKTFLADVLIQKDIILEKAFLKKPYYYYASDAGVYYFETNLGTKYPISDLIFETDAINHADAVEVYDFSENNDDSIKGYVVKNEVGNTYSLYINSDKKIMANADMTSWISAVNSVAFSGYAGDASALKEIRGLENVDFSNVTTLRAMFYGCRGLTELDLSSLDTSNVTNMAGMFSGCSGLTSLDLSGLDTSNVTNMGSMFWGCSGLTTLDLSPLDTSNVTDMGSMFYGCSGLTSLDMRNANFTKVTSYNSMFYRVPSNINIIVKDTDAENFIKTKTDDWPSTGTVTIVS